MLSKGKLSQLRALRQKKGRREQGLFVAEGSKLVLELLDSSFGVEALYALEPWMKQHRAVLSKAKETVAVTADELSRISSLVTPQDVLAVVRTPQEELNFSALAEQFTLVLDGIRDPGNLGTIIRIADWFGIRDIICSPDSAETWNPKVVQASMGSITRVRVHELPLEEFFPRMMKQLPAKTKLPVYGTFLEGKDIYHSPLATHGFLVIGNEANGIRPETETFITDRITIPSFSSAGGPESLNAAVATAIACSEFRRRMPGREPSA